MCCCWSLTGHFKTWYVNVHWHYLHPLFTAAEQASVCELQSFFGTGTFLSFILQTAKVALIDRERLKSLLWTQVTLLEQVDIKKKLIISAKY